MRELICKGCGTLFVRGSNRAKYHSTECRIESQRADKARVTREYGYKKFGWKPRPTDKIQCPMCPNIFLPKTGWQRCCSKRCGSRLRYKENPNKHREKTKRLRLKTHEAWKARGRMTWAEMKAQRGDKISIHMKARYPWLSQLNAARANARNRGLPFNLTREWADARWTGRCELTGLEFVLNAPTRTGFSPSIDKIEPAKGYVQDNCRFVLWAINMFKGTNTDADMYRIAAALLEP